VHFFIASVRAGGVTTGQLAVHNPPTHLAVGVNRQLLVPIDLQGLNLFSVQYLVSKELKAETEV